jgi:uncharacterized protein YndB with AHSA1/START domain
MNLEQLPSPPGELRLRGTFYDFTPEQLFAFWTQPALLKQWWPREAQVTPGVGGGYVLSWPHISKTLRGTYNVYDPGHALAFTWQWDDEPQRQPPITVALAFAPLDTSPGTVITLTQGPHPDTPEGQQLRASHLEGWEYFLDKLSRLAPAGDWTGNVDRELDKGE